MSKRNPRNRWDMAPAEIMAAYLEDREDELLDAVVTSATLVARADGWVQPVERSQLFDFLDRKQLLSLYTSNEVLDVFERCVRELREPKGPAAALERLRRYAGQPLARSLVEIAEEVAAADCRLDDREQRILHLIRTVLHPPSSPSPSLRNRAGGTA